MSKRRGLPPDTDLVAWFLSLEPEEWPDAIDQLGEEDRETFDRDWGSWAHRGQEPPATCPDGTLWRTWVLMAGRGFGKTLAGAKWITARIATGEPLHIALVGATLEEARRIMVEGRSGLLEVADAWISEWQPSLRRLSFRTGAVATLFSGASPEQLRGPEHHLAWCDELAKWEKPQESWDMLQFGLRLGDHPRALITTTPRPGALLTAIIAEPDTVRTGGPTGANPHNPKAWIESTHRLYAGTRLGRQELDGELLPDVAGALWTVELLERCRAEGDRDFFTRRREDAKVQNASLREAAQSRDPRENGASPGNGEEYSLFAPSRLRVNQPFSKIVIAVDPPTGDGTCGIIACAKDEAGTAHILADHSVTAQSPEGWAKAVANAVRVWGGKGAAGQEPSPSMGEGWVGVDSSKMRCGSQKPPHPRSLPIEGREEPSPIPLVVAEKNQGGKMVQSVLHTADPRLRVKLVTATVGKAERAAPVAMLFEAGRVVLHGVLPELEAEMLGMIAGGEYEGPGVSPDRADAMVWGLTELMLAPEKAPPRVRSF